MKLKINLRFWALFFGISLFFKPLAINSLQQYAQIDKFWDIGRILVCAYVFYSVVVKEKKISKCCLYIVLLELVFLFSTLIYNGDVKGLIVQGISIISFCLLISSMAKKDLLTLCKAMFYSLSTLILIHFIFSILYPEGLGYDLRVGEKVFVNSKEITNVNEYVDKISENEYVYTQVINIMDVNKNNLNLEITIDEISSGTIHGFENGDNEAIKIGKTIKSEVELNGNENESVISEQKIDDHTKVIIEKIANTKFQTYITAKKIVEDITYKEYNENSMKYTSFLVTDENDNSISKIIYDGSTAGKKIYVNENGNLKEKTEIKETDKIMQEENFIILISSENDSANLKVTPVKSRIFEDRNVNENGQSEEKEMYNKATWYPVKVGDSKYSAKSGLGGTFTVEKIDANDENIVFSYNENGSLGDEWKIIIREKIDDMNYINAIKEEIKGVNSKENKIIFSRNLDRATGLNLNKMSLDNLDNLEFTLLFGCVTEKVGEPVNLKIPTEDSQTAKINNLEIID